MIFKVLTPFNLIQDILKFLVKHKFLNISGNNWIQWVSELMRDTSINELKKLALCLNFIIEYTIGNVYNLNNDFQWFFFDVVGSFNLHILDIWFHPTSFVRCKVLNNEHFVMNMWHIEGYHVKNTIQFLFKFVNWADHIVRTFLFLISLLLFILVIFFENFHTQEILAILFIFILRFIRCFCAKDSIIKSFKHVRLLRHEILWVVDLKWTIVEYFIKLFEEHFIYIRYWKWLVLFN